MTIGRTLGRALPAMIMASALVIGTGATTAAAPPQTLAAPDIPVAEVQGYLADLQGIADANGGNRAHGQPGHQATVDYLKGKLDAAGFTTAIQEFDEGGQTGFNLIADWPGGAEDQTLMLGGHMDSVEEGPGINDNGSGSAGLLAVALAVSANDFHPTKHLRFAWWGAEELGLVGSTHYVDSLSADAKSAISGYLNFDMTGSPNPGYFVYSSDGEPEGSAQFQQVLTDYYTGIGVETEEVVVGGRSDHAAFSQAGIATGGTFSGAEEIMTAEQAQKWGGTEGKAFDECYHASCDTKDNINEPALDKNTDGIASALWTLAS